MIINEEKQKELRKKIEEMLGSEQKTPKDFDFLAASIFLRTKQKLSPTTLKRFWGYIEKDSDSRIRTSTLDILSQYAGYTSWDSFCNNNNKINGSDFLAAKELHTANIVLFTVIRLLWEPDRCVTVRYEGSDLFTVIESINSKLSVGDTFHCGGFATNQPLVLMELIHQGMPPCSYICGKAGGIKFEVV